MTSEIFDRETDRAWGELEALLAEYLETTPAGRTLLIEMPSPLEDLDGASPYVQLTIEEDGFTRAEASSNNYLDPRFALTPERIAQVETMGWQPPTHSPHDEPDEGSANYWYDAALPADAARLSALLVGTIRDVFGVPHPSFLVASGFGDEGWLEADDLPLGLDVPQPDDAEEPAPVVIAEPDGPDHLRDLVEAALRTFVEHDLVYDDDGDIPVAAEGTTIYVRVEEEIPSIHIFARVVNGVRWTPRVGSTLVALNKRYRYIKVTFHNGVVFASVNLYAVPFVSSQLVHAVKGMQSALEDLVPELEEELDGDVFSPSSWNASDGSDDCCRGRRCGA